MMTYKLRAALVTSVATALTAGVFAVPAGAAAGSAGGPSHQPAKHRLGTTSLATVLAADGHGFDRNWGDFDILDRAVKAVLKKKPDSSVALLAKGQQRATVFAPTDRAFRKLVRALTGKAPMKEKATFRALASAAGIDTIESVLLYHVVPGKTLTSAKVLKSDGARLTTAQGGVVVVNVTKNGVRLIDRDRDARNAKVVPRLLDINKGNRQIAHGINRVLRPIDL
jgi:uncharacterized surface protein with fasciclin (FAS1) repeats